MSMHAACPDLCSAPAPCYLPEPWPPIGATAAPVTPIAASLAPPSASVGGADMTLEVKGFRFASGTKIVWDGAPVATTFVNPNTLRTTIRPSVETAARQVPVTARTDTLTAVSTLQFEYTPAVPVVSTLVPATAPIGGADIVLEVQGSAFASDSVIVWDGAPVATTFVSATALRTTIRPSVETVARQVPVTARTGAVVATATQQFQYTAAA